MGVFIISTASKSIWYSTSGYAHLIGLEPPKVRLFIFVRVLTFKYLCFLSSDDCMYACDLFKYV